MSAIKSSNAGESGGGSGTVGTTTRRNARKGSCVRPITPQNMPAAMQTETIRVGTQGVCSH